MGKLVATAKWANNLIVTHSSPSRSVTAETKINRRLDTKTIDASNAPASRALPQNFVRRHTFQRGAVYDVAFEETGKTFHTFPLRLALNTLRRCSDAFNVSRRLKFVNCR
ncbi:MAG: hypothetical protein IPN23_10695 [Elusimicrobia bacterium]|nr:hypothetical protein [Elusimicrobiota bacterium]